MNLTVSTLGVGGSPCYSHIYSLHIMEKHPVASLLLCKYFPVLVPGTIKWLFTHGLYLLMGKREGQRREGRAGGRAGGREAGREERREGNLSISLPD